MCLPDSCRPLRGPQTAPHVRPQGSLGLEPHPPHLSRPPGSPPPPELSAPSGRGLTGSFEDPTQGGAPGALLMPGPPLRRPGEAHVHREGAQETLVPKPSSDGTAQILSRYTPTARSLYRSPTRAVSGRTGAGLGRQPPPPVPASLPPTLLQTAATGKPRRGKFIPALHARSSQRLTPSAEDPKPSVASRASPGLPSSPSPSFLPPRCLSVTPLPAASLPSAPQAGSQRIVPRAHTRSGGSPHGVARRPSRLCSPAAPSPTLPRRTPEAG